MIFLIRLKFKIMNRTFLIKPLLVIGIFAGMFWLPCKAQTRQQAQDEINAYREKVFGAFEVFLDASKPETVRLNAIAPYSRVIDFKQLLRCAEVAKNEREPDVIRGAALSRTYAYASRDAALFKGVISWVMNSKNPELAKASLNTLLLMNFDGTSTSYSGQEITRVMHELTGSRDPEYRMAAFGLLTMQEDTYALGIILKDLASLDTSRLSTVEGLIFLNNYQKKSEEIYRAVYGVYNKPVSQQARIESIRLLGGYTPALETVISVLHNQQEAPEVRLAALNMLQASSPQDKLEGYITPVVFNEKENEALRVVALKQMMYIKQSKQERIKSKRPGKFSDDVYQLSQTSAVASVKAAATEFVLNVNTKY